MDHLAKHVSGLIGLKMREEKQGPGTILIFLMINKMSYSSASVQKMGALLQAFMINLIVLKNPQTSFDLKNRSYVVYWSFCWRHTSTNACWLSRRP
jgi:hypothetical protein